MYSSTNTIKGN